MSKLDYLNLGCGNKFHKEWINVDMTSNSKFVKSHNLRKGIPFSDGKIDVIYHSQVLEHFPKEDARKFIRECFRVLKPGGTMRIVVPDLENIVNEYLNCLNENIENPTRQAEANYDWILLEMYDQTVRNFSGGQMEEFLNQPGLINEQYIINRIGQSGKIIRDNSFSEKNKRNNISDLMTVLKNMGVKKFCESVLRKTKNVFSSEAQKISSFRLGGEIHMWMYDRFSLSRLLRETGFEYIEIKTPYESNIPQWAEYELDVKDGVAFDPNSLFLEAKKPG
jgi:predicted SAM-dependent methyltransferase